MRVIEITHIEGCPSPLITLDGEPMPLGRSVTAHWGLSAPTKVFVSGVRVTEPTRVVKRGVVVAQDDAGTETSE